MDTDKTFAVASNLGAYALVQRAALQLLGPSEFRVYCALSTYCAGDTREVWPSRRTLAELCSCSVDTVDRALRSLVKDGWITKEKRRDDGHQDSNLYTVHYIIGAPQLDQGRMGAAQLSTDQGRTTPRNQSRTGAARVLPVGGLPKPTPPAAPPARARDEVWDAVVAAFWEPTNEVERRRIGKVVRALKESGATGAQVRRRCAAWDDHWRPDGKGSAPTLTVESLAKHWSALGVTAGDARPEMTPEEHEQHRREQDEIQERHAEMIRNWPRREST